MKGSVKGKNEISWIVGLGQDWRDLWVQGRLGGIYSSRTGLEGSMGLGQDLRDLRV